jgi:siderophore synthetase component
LNVTDTAPSPTRAPAEGAARQRLLNAYLRETLQVPTPTGDGRARLPLPSRHSALIVALRHYCVLGNHVYGDEIRLEGPGSPPVPIQHDGLVRLLLIEVEAAAAAVLGSSGDGGQRRAALAEHIAGSVEATARYLRHPRSARVDEPWALTRHAEQSLLFGHPFHPTPKSTQGFGAELDRYAPELGAEFTLHWFAVAPDALVERRAAPGSWIPGEVAERAAAALGPGRRHYPLLPAHPWQADYLIRHPRIAELVAAGTLVPLGPLGACVYPTSSVRTVCDPKFGTSWKLPLHVRITNFVRNNPFPHLVRAADASAMVARRAPGWRHQGFGVVVESGFRTVNPALVGDELAADLAVLFRDNPFAVGRSAPRVVASLLEVPEGGTPELITEVRRAADETSWDIHVARWLRQYLHVFLIPLLEVFGNDGISFEAHVQNSLLHTDNGWPTRFWVRDMEGTSVSRQRLSAGLVPDDSPLLYDDDEAWLRLRYHAVTNHLGHLVHVLGHHGGVAETALWRTAREVLAEAPGEPARALLRAPALPAKANLLSRFAERGENPLYVDIPNPLAR